MNKFWKRMVTMDFVKRKRMSKKEQLTHIMTLGDYQDIKIENVGQGNYWFYFYKEKGFNLIKLQNVKNIKVEYYG